LVHEKGKFWGRKSVEEDIKIRKGWTGAMAGTLVYMMDE